MEIEEDCLVLISFLRHNPLGSIAYRRFGAQTLKPLAMRTEGLEPTHLAVLEPKSSASANSATSAYSLHYNSKDTMNAHKGVIVLGQLEPMGLTTVPSCDRY